MNAIVGCKGPSVWATLRGMLGADDLADDVSLSPLSLTSAPTANSDGHSVRVMSHHEGDPVLRAPSNLNGASGRPNDPRTGLGLRLGRCPSMDSVFYSDSGSDAATSSPAFPASSPPQNKGFPPSLHLSQPHQHQNGSPNRYHHRARSHGGAIASPVALMASIREEPHDAPGGASGVSGKPELSPIPMRRTASSGAGLSGLAMSTFQQTPPSPSSLKSPQSPRSPGTGRVLGLTISKLTADEDFAQSSTRLGSGVAHGNALVGYGQRGFDRSSRSRYSFGEVDAEGMGLGLHTAGRK